MQISVLPGNVASSEVGKFPSAILLPTHWRVAASVGTPWRLGPPTRLLFRPTQPPSMCSHNESPWLSRAAKIVELEVDVREKFTITHLAPRRRYGAMSACF